jgi:drug/metabolite transporter (DMT)-like permease
MDQRRTRLLWIGLVLLIVGGAVLSWAGPNTGTVLGTTLGLAGAGLIGWSWARSSGPRNDD